MAVPQLLDAGSTSFQEFVGVAIVKAGALLPHAKLVFEIFQAFEDGADYQGEGYCGIFEDFG